MSDNCVRCVTNKRTAPDLLCDACRKGENGPKPCPFCGAPNTGTMHYYFGAGENYCQAECDCGARGPRYDIVSAAPGAGIVDAIIAGAVLRWNHRSAPNPDAGVSAVAPEGDLPFGMIRITGPTGEWIDDLPVSRKPEFARGFITALRAQELIDCEEEQRCYEEIGRLCDESGADALNTSRALDAFQQAQGVVSPSNHRRAALN